MAQRISIGFQASPPLALRVSEEELARLRTRWAARAGTTSTARTATSA